MTVARFSDGRIPWPLARNVLNGGRGHGTYVLCGDLVKALRLESNQAIQYWWGVGVATVVRWRRELGVPQFNPGTKRLWSAWRKAKLPRGSADPVVEFSPTKMRKIRTAAGLSQRAVAKSAGWNLKTYTKREKGIETRATRKVLRKIAKALGCRESDLIA
jgi:DNA-binding XRE family transcriptional regulator